MLGCQGFSQDGGDQLLVVQTAWKTRIWRLQMERDPIVDLEAGSLAGLLDVPYDFTGLALAFQFRVISRSRMACGGAPFFAVGADHGLDVKLFADDFQIFMHISAVSPMLNALMTAGFGKRLAYFMLPRLLGKAAGNGFAGGGHIAEHQLVHLAGSRPIQQVDRIRPWSAFE